MYPNSYSEWQLAPHCQSIIDPQTHLEVRTMEPGFNLLSELKCRNGCISSFINYGTTERTIIDFDPVANKCVLVKLQGPVMRCQNCKATIDTPTLVNNIPPKVKISRDVLPVILDHMVKNKGMLGGVARACGMSTSAAKKLVRETVNAFTSTIETYAPCEVLFFLPFRYGDNRAMLVGGIDEENEVLLYDILPCYSQHGINITFDRLSDCLHQIKLIVIDLDKNAYEICKKRCPDADIDVSFTAFMNHVGKIKNSGGDLNLDKNKYSSSTVTQQVKEWYSMIPNHCQKDIFSNFYDQVCACEDAVDSFYDTQYPEEHFKGVARILDDFRKKHVAFDTMRYLCMTYQPAVTGLANGGTVSSPHTMCFIGPHSSSSCSAPITTPAQLLYEAVNNSPAPRIYSFAIHFRDLATIPYMLEECNAWEERYDNRG